MTGHSRDQNWQCQRCGIINVIGVNFECGGCRANGPIPPAVNTTRKTHSSAAPLTDQEIKGQTALLELVREMGNVRSE